MPLLAIEYITILKFETPCPVLKKLITKSYIDKVKAINDPVIIPGIICGIITFLNTYKGLAPKSIAASAKWTFICFNFGNTERITYGIEKVTCDKSMVKSPNSILRNLNKVNK